MTTLGFVVYLLCAAVIGIVAWRRTHDVHDYVLGGRRISALTAALSAGASDMSGWLLLGLPGLAVAAAGEAAWLALGLLLGTWLNWRLVAPRLRAESQRFKALTLPAFFAARFDRHTKLLRLLSALSIVLFFVLYTSAGFVAGGKLFVEVFALPYPIAVIGAGAVILLYTCFGGFLAVVWTDVMQAAMMLIALTAVAYLLCIGTTVEQLQLDSVLALADWSALSALAWGLGYFGQPHILARFMAMGPEQSMTAARRIAVAWSLLGLTSAIVIGAMGASLLAPQADAESVFIVATQALLPGWFAGFCLAAILAAIMSTADSQLLVAAAVWAEDLLPGLRQQGADDAARLRVGRYAVAVITLLAVCFALTPDAGVFTLVSRAWAGLGATLGPMLLIALYAPRATAEGALAGFISGALVVVVWPYLPQAGFAVYELLPAFVSACMVNLGVNHWLQQAR